MKPWEARSEEVANLLNPAFCGRIIYQTVHAHQEEGDSPMHYALAFLVLPLALYPETQATISGRVTHFNSWISVNQHVKIGLAHRAKVLVPYGREALTFLSQVGILKINPDNATLTVADRLRSRRRGMLPLSQDTKVCLEKAGTLGRWFARLNSAPTAFASLGLMP